MIWKLLSKSFIKDDIAIDVNPLIYRIVTPIRYGFVVISDENSIYRFGSQFVIQLLQYPNMRCRAKNSKATMVGFDLANFFVRHCLRESLCARIGLNVICNTKKSSQRKMSIFASRAMLLTASIRVWFFLFAMSFY